MNNRTEWLNIFIDITKDGKDFSPRGQKTNEIEDYMFSIHPLNRFCSFSERKLSLKYLVAELCWYLKGDPNDLMMEHYAKFWATIKNSEKPYYHSNYGKYIFGENQYEYVIRTLIADKDSRQASIIINRPNVMMSDSKDKICTYAINFRIRDNKLNMSVNMRSNDLIRGTTIDVFQFSVVYEMVYVELKSYYPELEIGTYKHKADSFHVYEQHFGMVKDIVHNNYILSKNTYEEIVCPRISSVAEVEFIIDVLPRYEEVIRTKQTKVLQQAPEEYRFFKWCVNQLSK